MLSSSFLEVLCLWASLLANNFIQLTLTPLHKLFSSSQYRGEEMVARSNLSGELLRGAPHRDGVEMKPYKSQAFISWGSFGPFHFTSFRSSTKML